MTPTQTICERQIEPLGLPVLGALPESELLVWPERHLGLRAAQEGGLPTTDDLTALAESHLDVDGLMALIGSSVGEEAQVESTGLAVGRRKLALAQDEAFHFYYPRSLDCFDIVPFSPLRDKTIPDADAVIIGGGFPEMFAEELTQNSELRSCLKELADFGKPILGECGGLMYLAEHLEVDGQEFPMCGAMPGKVQMAERLQHFGYCSGGESTKGHEFHHSKWLGAGDHANLWQVTKRRTGKSRMEGYKRKNMRATYVHSMWGNEIFEEN